MLSRDRFVVYGGTANHGFDAAVLRFSNNLTKLGLEFSHCWHNIWPDGEPGFRIADYREIEDRHALIFSCPVSHKLLGEFEDLITACKRQYGARSVIAVMSFLRFRRQDHPEPAFHREIARLRWLMSDLKHWGADALVACEPHSVEHTRQYCDEFGLVLHVSDPTRLFADAVRGTVQALGGREAVRIYSPDFGSVGRALALANQLGLSVIATPKRRVNGRLEFVPSDRFLADVRAKFGEDAPVSCDLREATGRHLIMREDEVDSGGTAVSTARMLKRDHGAASMRLVATHPVCSRGWKMRLFPEGEEQPFQNIWLGNTRPRGDGETDYEGSTGGKVTKVDIAPAVAETLADVLERLTD